MTPEPGFDPHPGARFDATVFRAVFDAHSESVLLVDSAGVIQLANPAASHLLGYSAEQLVGLNVDALVPLGVVARHAGLREGYAHAPRSRPMGSELELTARRADGSEVMVEIALSPLTIGTTLYVVASLRGIGAYPRVQRAMRRARYSECVGQVGRVAADAHDTDELTSCVAAFAAQALEVECMTVWLLETNRLEFHVASFFMASPAGPPPVSVPNRPDTLLGYVAAQSEAVTVSSVARENRFNIGADLRQGRAECALAVPMIGDGQVIGVLTASSVKPGRFGDDERSFLDALANLVVTSLQRSRSEAQLAHSQRMESVGQLTGGIAHDFNNLLTVIQGNLQMLADHPGVAGNELLAQMVGAASRASNRGAELTSKLLAFSRRQALAAGPVNVGELLHSLADMLRRTLGTRITVAVHVHPGCPPCHADAGQLESALLNIAVNSRDAMPDGGALTFSCASFSPVPAEMRGVPGAAADPGSSRASSADAGGPECVSITIKDTGVGMSAAVLDRAFEPFFTTKEAGKGTGLGLSTVYGFVKQSGGHLKVDSSPGAGTSIQIYLPAARTQPVARPRAAAPAAELPRGTRVLMAEDEPGVRAVALAFFEAMGCQVTACIEGESALVELRRGQVFELLFSDINLGEGMNGIELAEQARALAPRMAILLTSGYSIDLSAESPRNPQHWPVLHKPYSREELMQAAGEVLESAGRV